jgi:spermidine synthase
VPPPWPGQRDSAEYRAWTSEAKLTKDIPLKDLIHRLALAGDREREIYRTQDIFGPVVVRDCDGVRILSFDSLFEQSAMQLENPFALVHEYTQVMLLVLMFSEPRQVTLLGLGGGSLLRILHKHCTTTLFQVIELRESVIQIACEHFFVPNDERIVIHNRNGNEYVQEAPGNCTDILFADMYHAYSMDEFQSTTDFLEQSWRLLTTDGWLVINFHQLPEFDHPYMQRMRTLFPEVVCCGTNSGNYLVMCGKQPLAKPLPAYHDHLVELEQRFDVCLRKSFARLFKFGSSPASMARANSNG